MQTSTPAQILRRTLITLVVLAGAYTSGTRIVHSTAAVTPTSISQLPLTIAVPAHPQVVLAIGNSQSMDGDLSGAIMTGSGALGASTSLLQNTSSPVNFAIPSGFTPPLNPGAGGTAPYTVTSGGTQYDNSASRLNVAKAGIAAMLTSFIPNADFALLDYDATSVGLYTTWLYEMSPTTGPFVFTNTQVLGNRYVANPCFGYLSVTGEVNTECGQIASSGKVTTTSPDTVNTAQYMQVSASSDDPLINDVLYDSGAPAVCIVYGGPNPSSPYTGYTLADYVANPNNILEAYTGDTTGGCATETGPTNAGYVPYTPETIYVERGFGYYSFSQSATSATTLVGMTSAGATPTATSVATAIAQFTPYLAPETNNGGTTEIKATAGQSALPGLIAGASAYFKSANPPSSNGCTAKRYVILLTDGLPTLDLSGGSWPPPGTTTATAWGVTPGYVAGVVVGFNPDGSLNTSATNDQAVLDTISQLANLQAKGISTYVIGLGAGVEPSVNPVAAQVLTAMAIAGGTGTYFAATNPAALTTDLQAILANILAATQSTASTAVNSTGLQNGSVAYLAQFTTSDTFQDWTGNLFAFPINPATGVVDTAPADALWSARAQLDAVSWDTGRLIATWDPVAKTGIPFRWSAVSASSGINPGSTLGQQLETFTPDTNGQDVLQFLRGSSAQELRNGGQFRNRTHKLGDIVASAPLYIGIPNGYTQSTSYFNFVTANSGRPPTLYVGADDGMLHAFNASSGNELFAYIPNGVYSNLIKLANPYYNQSHLFYVNGSPQASDVQFNDGSWHTVLVGSEGAGGQSLFALDVTNPASLTTESQLAQAALWEFNTTTDADMGYSFSTPAFATTNTTSTVGGWLVFAGNGYNSVNQKPVLYAINPQTGALVAKVDLCAAVPTACNMTLANGLSSVAVVNSYGQVSLPANTVYAGDLQGNVWRVDISNSNPTLWAVTAMYQARDNLGNMQPITTTPAVTLNPQFPQVLGTLVNVGTGQLLGLSDLTTTGTQSLYALFDPPSNSAPPLGFSGIPTRANLVQQTLTNSTADGITVQVETTVQPVTFPTNRGWYIDFNLAAGERIVTNPELGPGGAVILTTYQPNSSSCTGGGNAWLMVLNYATGGSFPLPELDLNGSTVLNAADQTASGLNPVGMSMGAVYASEPTVLGGTGGAGGGSLTTLETSISNGTVLNTEIRGQSMKRISWWEVRH
jgi:type IV pilus assembly protein PilY1